MRNEAMLLCLTLLAPFAAAGQQAPPRLPSLELGDLPEVVARVDGEEITRRELIDQAQTMRLQAVEAGAGDPGGSEQFLTLVLDALIGERLVYADSRTRGVGPSEAEIDEGVKGVIAAYGGEESFDRTLQAKGLDRRYVRRQVTQTLSFNKVMESEIKPTIEISDEAVAGYYERNKDRLKVPTYYKLRHIMKQKGDSTESEQAARGELEALRQQVIGGADLATLAKEHSDDAKTREQGGEMPWIVLTGRGGELDAVISGLRTGDLSGIVETPVGLHLIRLEDLRPERTKTLDEAREEIVNILAANEARQEIQRRVERLRSSAKVEILM